MTGADPLGRVFPEPLPEQALAIRPAPAPVPQTGFLENLGATADEMLIAGNVGAPQANLDAAYGPLIDALHGAGELVETDTGSGFGRVRLPFENPYRLPEVAEPGHLSREQALGAIWERIARRRRTDPGFLSDAGANREEFEQRVQQRTAEQLRQIRDVQSRATGWGQVGGFVGGMGGSLLDPINLLTLPLGGSSPTLLGTFARGAIENGIADAVTEPLVYGQYRALGEEHTGGDMLRNILYASVGGGAFHTGMRVGGRAAGATYDRLLSGVFNALPEPVQRRWADAATIGEVPLTDILRAVVPEEAWTPDLRSAVHVLDREAEIRAASPFEPSAAGDEAHGASLGAALTRIVANAPPIRAARGCSTCNARAGAGGRASGFRAPVDGDHRE